MNHFRQILQSAIAVIAILHGISYSEAAAVASFADIEFWVGSGANSAAIAIDWADDTTNPPALVWGFRWDGAATGRTMLEAIVTADPRLFAKTDSHGGGLGSALYGLGYDDGDSEFALSDDTAFDPNGFAGATGGVDGAEAIDAGDLYEEGWRFGYWNYGLASGNPYGGGKWTPSIVGMSSRTLHNGDWDSWTFTPTFNDKAFAANPIAALPPATGDDADFNGDGVVDGNDFLAWQRGFGTPVGATPQQGDANGDGAVDATDLAAWRSQFGRGSDAPTLSATASIPEPSSLALAGAALLCLNLFRRR